MERGQFGWILENGWVWKSREEEGSYPMQGQEGQEAPNLPQRQWNHLAEIKTLFREAAGSRTPRSHGGQRAARAYGPLLVVRGEAPWSLPQGSYRPKRCF